MHENFRLSLFSFPFLNLHSFTSCTEGTRGCGRRCRHSVSVSEHHRRTRHIHQFNSCVYDIYSKWICFSWLVVFIIIFFKPFFSIGMDYSSSNVTFYGLTEDKDLCLNISIIDDNLVEGDEENFTVEAVYTIGSETSTQSNIIRIKNNDGEI